MSPGLARRQAARRLIELGREAAPAIVALRKDGDVVVRRNAVRALEGRDACLLEHHGLIAVGKTLPRAMWMAIEVETLARQYHGCLAIGTPRLLTEDQIRDVADKVAGYGHQG